MNLLKLLEKNEFLITHQGTHILASRYYEVDCHYIHLTINTTDKIFSVVVKKDFYEQPIICYQHYKSNKQIFDLINSNSLINKLI
jgi:hypothetical protein